MMRLRILTLILIFAFVQISYPQNLDLGGYLKFFAHPNLNSPNGFNRLGTRLQTTFSYGTDNAFFYSSLDFNYEDTSVLGLYEESRGKGMTIYPVEAYIDLYWTNFEMRLGKQFIFWGKTDWLNPTDNINPWDYKNITSEVEDYRLPVTAVKGNLYFGNFNLESVLLLHFEPHKIPVNLPPVMGGLELRNEPTVFPENKLSNLQYAFRLSSQLFNVDYSFSYFHGFDRNPSLSFVFVRGLGVQPPYLTAQTSYKKIDIFGFDFVTTKDKFAFTGEAAYFLTEDKDGTDIYIKNPNLYYVVGLDYAATDDLSFNLQFSQKILFKYDKESEENEWLIRTRQARPVDDKITSTVTGKIQYSLGSYTSLLVIGVMNLKDKDFFLLPILNYNFADGVNISAGATWFNGPADSPFGRIKTDSKAFLEVKYSFSL